MGNLDIDKDKVFVFGRSLGGACAIYGASKIKGVRGVILENTFTCMGDVVDKVLPFVSFLKGVLLRNF